MIMQNIAINNPVVKVRSALTPQSRTPTPSDRQVRPMFISLNKYNQLKSCLESLNRESSALKSLISNLNNNKDTGAELLKETVNRLENIEEKVTQINATIKV